MFMIILLNDGYFLFSDSDCLCLSLSAGDLLLLDGLLLHFSSQSKIVGAEFTQSGVICMVLVLFLIMVGN
jgi:hypothetical protein